MRILFIHRDFPGIFRPLAQCFGSMPDTTTLFLSERGGKSLKLPGVRRLRIAPTDLPAADAGDAGESIMSVVLRRGTRAANAMLRLRRDGFSPDIVYYPADGGYGFYARDLFPDALHAVRADWFSTQGESHLFFTRGAARPPADFAAGRARNLCRYNALGDCDLALTGSRWQWSQFPDFLRNRIGVIHDGVDSAFFSPDSSDCFPGLPPGAEILSLSCRGTDPSRGLVPFLRALPRVLNLRPGCRAIIMDTGKDSADSVREAVRGAVPETMRSRVLLPDFTLTAYRTMLRTSTLHIYLTAPDNLSAGLFEAMSCGTLTLGSDTPPVHEILRHGENGFLCDFWDHEAMAETAARILDMAPRFTGLRETARGTILKDYDLATQTRRHIMLLLDALERKKGGKCRHMQA